MQAQSNRAGMLWLVTRAHKSAPSAWRYVRVSAREITDSHGRTSCCVQPANRVPRETDKRPRAFDVGAPNSPLVALPHGSSLSAVVAGVNTRRTTRFVLSGKKRRRPLQTKRPSNSERAPPHGSAPLRKLSSPGRLLRRWSWANGGITSSEVGIL